MMKRAKVYEDPLTRKTLEGEATIIAEWGKPDRDGLQQCTVRFDGDLDNPMVVRMVRPGDIEEQS